MFQAVRNALRSGLSTQKIALALAFAVIIGLFPILGTTTALCVILAYVLRLNLPLMQSVNWLLTPIQIAAIIPLMRLGAMLLGSPSEPDAAGFATALQTDFFNIISVFGTELLHAVLGWLVSAPLVGGIVYLLASTLLGPYLDRFHLERPVQ